MAKELERVFVTGIGIASPLGCGVREFWLNLLAGRTGVKALKDPDFSSLRTRIGAWIDDFDPQEYFGRKLSRRMSRSSQLAVLAADQAISQAGLTDKSVDPQSVAVIIGSSIGGFAASDPFFKEFHVNDYHTPLVIPIVMNNGPSSNVSIKYGFQGPLVNIDAACATGAHAIGYAYDLIRTGSVEIAVTGGADSPFSPGVVAAWCTLRVLSERNDNPQEACRPFSADRDGMVLGEGAGVLVLEARTSALRRGSQILGEIKGYGASSDGHHLTQPSKDGPALAMERALVDAGITAKKVDYINAHATGTIWNDRTETAAIKQVFGAHAFEIPVVGNKSALGHSIGASGALELISCILSLRDQVVPPTINYKIRDPQCDLDYVTDGSRSTRIFHAMSNSFAFGGSNAVLVAGHAAAE